MKTLLYNHMEDVKFLFLEGVGLRKIAKLYNVSNEGVRQALIRNGIDTSDQSVRNTYNSFQKVTMYDKKQMLNLYAEGIPNKEIAKKFNVSLTSVTVSLKQLGVKDVCSYHNQENFIRAKKFIALFISGESLNSIGKCFDCFPAVVRCTLIKELGETKYNEILSGNEKSKRTKRRKK